MDNRTEQHCLRRIRKACMAINLYEDVALRERAKIAGVSISKLLRDNLPAKLFTRPTK